MRIFLTASISNSAAMMRAFLIKPKGPVTRVVQHDQGVITHEIFTGYISDIEKDHDEEETEWTQQTRDVVDPAINTCENVDWEDVLEGPFHIQNPPPIKRQRHNIPIHITRKRQRIEVKYNLQQALIAIEKIIASKKQVFEAGRNGLQEYRAQAIQLHLHMVVRVGRKHIDASERAAESQGFAAK